MTNPAPRCPLCFGDRSLAIGAVTRPCFRCPACDLIHIAPDTYLDAVAEKAQYDLHENNAEDQAYRAFLSQLSDPLVDRLGLGATGLDFGCGPGPTLSVMLEELGYTVSLYDPFYAPDNGQLARTYDFITATEVAEHLHHPAQEFTQLWGLLRPGGVLGVMTWMSDDIDDLAGWHYMRDPTHICFYSKKSFHWLAEQLGGTLSFYGNKVILLSKPV